MCGFTRRNNYQLIFLDCISIYYISIHWISLIFRLKKFQWMFRQENTKFYLFCLFSYSIKVSSISRNRNIKMWRNVKLSLFHLHVLHVLLFLIFFFVGQKPKLINAFFESHSLSLNHKVRIRTQKNSFELFQNNKNIKNKWIT